MKILYSGVDGAAQGGAAGGIGRCAVSGRAEKLKSFYREKGRMPSYGELTRLLGYKSKRSAQKIVDKWVEKGVVRKDETGKLLPGGFLSALRVLGEVAAGWPSPAEEENADTISLDDWLVEDKEASFMLKVTGDSMIDAGINHGDYVILHRGKSPKNNDVVVAEVDKEWTIKFFRRVGKSVTLVPANKNYKPIVPKEELRVAGVVTAVIRKYA
ncbi:transcriptional repressor LexA [Patescibacteria group bacterium]|nr:transcriptional repressor LexA [Patescibacteria group bacterium]MBU1702842.1 transcriptional repressor LexA [Patescibacteria group bacterium]MBU1954285.1 transcriptional repressor LexA [Patescibacteria group bacterium]